MTKHAIFKKYCRYLIIDDSCLHPENRGRIDVDYIPVRGDCLQRNCPFWKELKKGEQKFRRKNSLFIF